MNEVSAAELQQRRESLQQDDQMRQVAVARALSVVRSDPGLLTEDEIETLRRSYGLPLPAIVAGLTKFIAGIVAVALVFMVIGGNKNYAGESYIDGGSIGFYLGAFVLAIIAHYITRPWNYYAVGARGVAVRSFTRVVIFFAAFVAAAWVVNGVASMMDDES